MPLSFNGINQSQIQIEGGVNISHTTALFAQGSRASAGTTTLGTVPANKRWLILNVAVGQSANAAVAGNASIQLNGSNILMVGSPGLAGQSVTANNSLHMNISACPVVTAGQTVTLVTDNNGFCYGSVVYVEESV